MATVVVPSSSLAVGGHGEACRAASPLRSRAGSPLRRPLVQGASALRTRPVAANLALAAAPTTEQAQQAQQQQQQQLQQQQLQQQQLQQQQQLRRAAAQQSSSSLAEGWQCAGTPGVALPMWGCSAVASQSSLPANLRTPRSRPTTPAATRPALAYGAHSLQGRKKAMPGCPNQDCHLVLPLAPGLMLAAIFDGHGRGGHLASNRARCLVEQNVKQLLAKMESRSGATAFAWLFDYVHELLVSEGLASFSGTTATVALIDLAKGSATVAHAGDSSLLVCHGGKVAFLSQDHRVDEPARRRILAAGGEVRETQHEGNTTVTRVFAPGSDFPGLAMARALGDQEAHALGVMSQPEVSTVAFAPGCVLVVASDGLWDKMSSTEAAQFVDAQLGAGRDVSEIAHELVTKGRERWRADYDIDDVTAVVVRAGVDSGFVPLTPRFAPMLTPTPLRAACTREQAHGVPWEPQRGFAPLRQRLGGC
eukprot:TRINITY_DN5409_c1_g1_i1.p1 TRINITY_DN5409_c1_g1~~TRINITY_DN5409_c1_g1_i1.p1  ORF type:complete len:478 (+),score=118.69 TRINITY_DN5409_c1_g1_i1:73-1506(+)